MVSRITTPLSDILALFVQWFDLPWFVWASAGFAVVAVVAAAVIARARSKARDSVPQYKRASEPARGRERSRAR